MRCCDGNSAYRVHSRITNLGEKVSFQSAQKTAFTPSKDPVFGLGTLSQYLLSHFWLAARCRWRWAQKLSVSWSRGKSALCPCVMRYHRHVQRVAPKSWTTKVVIFKCPRFLGKQKAAQEAHCTIIQTKKMRLFSNKTTPVLLARPTCKSDLFCMLSTHYIWHRLTRTSRTARGHSTNTPLTNGSRQNEVENGSR